MINCRLRILRHSVMIVEYKLNLIPKCHPRNRENKIEILYFGQMIRKLIAFYTVCNAHMASEETRQLYLWRTFTFEMKLCAFH